MQAWVRITSSGGFILWRASRRVCFAGSGCLVSGGNDAAIRLWDSVHGNASLASGAQVTCFQRGPIRIGQATPRVLPARRRPDPNA
jgi:hypothetical protein